MNDCASAVSWADRTLHRLCAGPAWLVVHPMRLPSVATPRLYGLPYRAFRLHSGDGTPLAAWHVPCEGSRRAVVLLHGHNDCRMYFLPLLRPLHEAGFHVLLFDFRSMGLSGGSLCSYGYREQEDARAAVEWLRRETDVEQIGLLGVSMGAATAILTAANDPGIQAVVSDCAFARLEEMVEEKFRYIPYRFRSRVGGHIRHWAERWCETDIRDVDPEAAVRSWKPRPLLVIHAEADLLIPPEHGRRLAAAATGDTELWMVPGASHARTFHRAGREYTRRVVEFFQAHL